MKVGRGGMSVLAIAAAATLVSTSTGTAFGASSQSRNLNLRLPGRAPGPQFESRWWENAVAWRVHGSANGGLRAAHALTTDGLRVNPATGPSSRLIIVRVRIDGRRTVRVLTNAVTAGALAEALFRQRPGVVAKTPYGNARLHPHQVVRLSVIRRVRRNVVEAVPFETLIHYSRDLAPGDVRVEQTGQVGRARRTYVITYRGGVEASRRLVDQAVLVEPVEQIEVHGPPVEQAAGVEYGDATWYGCDGMHAAHKTLPFGTPVTVTNLDNGATVTVTINDRGPYAEGRIIDLCDGAFAQIAPLGQGVAHVKISY
ncbi:MAG: RlpA-like double-psi beta-barrel domain-containing protein [Actinomycetota bacterium]